MHHDKETSSVAVDRCNDLLVKLLRARQQLCGEALKATDYQQQVCADEPSSLHLLLQQDYETCRDEWKDTLNRRHKDVRLHAGLTAKAQFRVVDASFWQQVDATVQHDKLRNSESTATFDDAKVYQHLLQDFVLSANRSDTQLVQDRLKSVKNKTINMLVDRKASKGRKIRYHELPKLVNFTFPLSRPQSQSVLEEGDWLSSLFGGAAKK